MIVTKGEIIAINQNTNENKDFDIAVCRLCSEFEKDEQLIKVCECIGCLQFVHFSCLESEVNKTQKDICCLCNTRYTGVGTKTIPKGFCQYICSDSKILFNVLSTLLVLSFLYYIIYLAVIDYIMSDGLVNQWLRIILIVPTVIYGLIFTFLGLGFAYKICSNYHEWRADHYRIVLTRTRSSRSQNRNIKSDSNSNKSQIRNSDIKGRNREKGENEGILGKDLVIKDLSKSSKQQNKSNVETKDSVSISMDLISRKSMQTLKENEKNEKELEFEDKTGTHSLQKYKHKSKMRTKLEKTIVNDLRSKSENENQSLIN